MTRGPLSFLFEYLLFSSRYPHYHVSTSCIWYRGAMRITISSVLALSYLSRAGWNNLPAADFWSLFKHVLQYLPLNKYRDFYKIVNSDVEAVTLAALRKKKTSSSCLLVSIRAFVSSTQCSTRDLPHNSYQIDHESIQPKTKHQSPYSLRTSTQG
jgi:hypothetical protein